MLKGETQPGVWFPEQREAVPDRRALLQARAVVALAALGHARSCRGSVDQVKVIQIPHTCVI